MDATDTLGSALLQRARNAIGNAFSIAPKPETPHEALAAPGATFVTLMLNGQLRGCIGMLEAIRPLDQDVRENAYAAAFRDSRFQPLSREEFDTVRIEVSLLGKPEKFNVASEMDAVSNLRPHQDGLILQYRGRRATFLPQVWDQLADPMAFLIQLKLKAGLPFNFWAPDIALYRYGVAKWKETGND